MAAEKLLELDPSLISPEVYKSLFREFLIQYLIQEIKCVLLTNSTSYRSSCIGLPVQCCDLIHFDSVLAYSVLHFPRLLLPIFDDAATTLMQDIASNPVFLSESIPESLSSEDTGSGRKGRFSQVFQVNKQFFILIRMVALPPLFELSKPTIGDIRAHNINASANKAAFVQVMGTVVKAGGVRLLEVSKQYECQNSKCRFRFTVSVDLEQDNTLPQPRQCPRSSMSGSGSTCKSTYLMELEGSRRCVDYQEVKIQDHIDRLNVGRVPRSITVLLKGDLVDRFNPGDDVIIVGEVIKQWRPVYRGVRCQLDIMIDANSIVAASDNGPNPFLGADNILAATSMRRKYDAFWDRFRSPGRGPIEASGDDKSGNAISDKSKLLHGRNIIVNSVCPQLCGMFFVKLSLLLTLVGGTHQKQSGNERTYKSTGSGGSSRRRYQSHMLIVGDPGCGKSQLLRFAADVYPRSILTTGVGTTGAGLTCTAVRDGSDWSLEAGALVLANEGVCCIDEFASMREPDRATIHEAMEQQTLSIAKAGLVVKLNTKTTVIACCNPKGQFDPTVDLTANTAIASPLLSRFDIIIVLQDQPQKEWDKKVSTFLLQQAVGVGGKRTLSSDSSSMEHWNMQQLREYISFVKHNIQPDLSAEAKCILMRYYQLQRQSDDRQSARTTVRLLESLVRLSEAHAKVMMREEVGIEDAITAITCVSLSQMSSSLSLLSSSTTDKGKGILNEMDSSDGLQYQQQEDKLFEQLRLTRSSLKELCRQDAKHFAAAIAESGLAAVDTAVGGSMVPDMASFSPPEDLSDIRLVAKSKPLNASNVERCILHNTRQQQQFWDMDEPEIFSKQNTKSTSLSILMTTFEAPTPQRQQFPTANGDNETEEEEENGHFRTGLVSQLRASEPGPARITEIRSSILPFTRPASVEERAMQPPSRERQVTHTAEDGASLGRHLPPPRIRPTISEEFLEDW